MIGLDGLKIPSHCEFSDAKFSSHKESFLPSRPMSLHSKSSVRRQGFNILSPRVRQHKMDSQTGKKL